MSSSLKLGTARQLAEVPFPSSPGLLQIYEIPLGKLQYCLPKWIQVPDPPSVQESRVRDVGQGNKNAMAFLCASTARGQEKTVSSPLVPLKNMRGTA